MRDQVGLFALPAALPDGQVRHVDGVPLIFVGKMWADLVEWAKKCMLDPRLRLASPEDFDYPALREHRGRGDRAGARGAGAVEGPVIRRRHR